MNTSLEVYNYLRQEILSLRLVPGSEIRLQDIEEKLNVSKSPIRFALQDLKHEGLVDIFPQSGTRVSKIDISLMEEERFLRTNLEIGVVRLFCNQPDEDALLDMSLCIESQKAFAQREKLSEFINADDLFHERIFKAVGYTRLWNLIQNQSGHYHRIRLLTFFDLASLPAIIGEHEAILDALKHRDKKAVTAVESKHIDSLDTTKIIAIKRNPDYFTGYDPRILRK